MKIPSSSSLLFATLAISSSSTSLAAPAGDAAHSESMSDVRHSALSARHASTSVPSMVVRNDAFSAHESRQMNEIIGAVGALPAVGPMLGPMLEGLLAPKAGAASVPAVLARDQPTAINAVPQVLPGPLGNVTLPSVPVAVLPSLPGLPVLPRSNSDGAADSSSADPSYTSTATDAPASSATQGGIDAAAFSAPLPSPPVALIPVIVAVPGLPAGLPAGFPAGLPAGLPALPVALPGTLGKRDEDVPSSSVDPSTSTATSSSVSSSATQGMDVAAFPMPLAIPPLVGSVPGIIPSSPVSPLASAVLPIASSLPLNLPLASLP